MPKFQKFEFLDSDGVWRMVDNSLKRLLEKRHFHTLYKDANGWCYWIGKAGENFYVYRHTIISIT